MGNKQHQIEIFGKEFYWVARCSCGWIVQGNSQKYVEIESADHVVAATQTED